MYKRPAKSRGYPSLPTVPYRAGATTLRSNMCQLQATIGAIYNYSITFAPKIDDSLTRLKKDIVKGCAEELNKIFGSYVHSGNNIYSLRKTVAAKVVSSVIEPKMKVKYEVTIVFGKEISLKRISGFTAEQNQEVEMVFNIYLKKVMEAQRLYSSSKSRFFDEDNVRGVAGTNLNSKTGYFISVSAIKEGLYLTIDTVVEFSRKESCLKEIKDMRAHGFNEKQIVDSFKGKRVSLRCAKGKTWRISNIMLNSNPINCLIQPDNIPLIKQWEEKYKVKVTDRSQPLLKAKRKGEVAFLIPEFCYVAGLEEESKKFGKGLNDLGTIGAAPHEKDKSIVGMFEKLAKGQALEQYGLMMLGQTRIPLQLLPKPQLRSGPGKVMSPEMLAKGVRIMNPINFKRWVMIYEGRNYNNAEQIFKTMVKASGALGVSVEEPEWVELEYINAKSLENSLNGYKESYQFVLVLLSDRYRQYRIVKRFLDIAKGVISQCVCADYKKVTNMTCVSNIIRQINAKLGGDLYTIELPPEIPKNTMFVGIDVCHIGRNSVVGFYSNAYTNLAQCYCETTVQGRGQEIVSLLTQFYANAIKTYYVQQKKYPEYIFVYRDGVGRSQRDQVLAKELPQLKEALQNMKKGYTPEITLVIVNKRVHQRFLLEMSTGVGNPEPGTVIDTLVTENGCENFYMISAEAKKGTIRPTHYYIAANERKEVNKLTIQKTSYAMAFMYYNTPWSLKVPAQIALADRKAYYVANIDGPSNKRLVATESFL
eukprot:TRINITY_DN4601_c0_g1_i1.p1 TRINITY_DN4601_c0_g1~~TRINITY_DN4601_c0_g1_i1.p1  ORF type:complete len:761 (-),score=209.66 TRINITY_DN4601_c0_g1_i1:75-2357(-)